jgi:hypothetical protein
MGEYPGVEVRRQTPLIEDVATLAIETSLAIGRRAYDLMIGEYARHAVRALERLARHQGAGAVGPNYRSRANPLEGFRRSASFTGR